jgi:hypothetical protein
MTEKSQELEPGLLLHQPCPEKSHNHYLAYMTSLFGLFLSEKGNDERRHNVWIALSGWSRLLNRSHDGVLDHGLVRMSIGESRNE